MRLPILKFITVVIMTAIGLNKLDGLDDVILKIYANAPGIIDESEKYNWRVERGGFYAIEDVVRSPSGRIIAVGSHIIEYADGIWRASQSNTKGLSLNDIEMLSGDDWVAVGAGGAVLRETKEGVLSNIIDSKSDLMSVEFLRDIGLIAGVNNNKGVVYRLSGSDWKKENIPNVGGLLTIEIVSDDDIWIAGYNGAIIHFDGKRWSTSASFTTMNFYGSEIDSFGDLWLVGGRTVSAFSGKYIIIRLHNQEWVRVAEGNDDQIEDIVISGSVVWVVAGGTIYQLREDKLIVFSIGNIITFDSFVAILCDSRGDIEFAVSKFGSIFQRFDNEMKEVHSSYGSASAVAASADSDIWINAASRGSVVHFDRGKWVEMPVPGVSDIDLIAKDNIWAVGRRGLIYHYELGAWKIIPSPTQENFTTIKMINDKWGYAIAIHGRELKSEIIEFNDGVWNNMMNFNEVTYDIDAISRKEIAIIGNGTIYHLRNGVWSKIVTPGQLYSIDMISDDNIWAVGMNLIMNYDGNEWRIIHGAEELRLIVLNRIVMIDENNGWAVGDQGIIMRFTDGIWNFARRPSGTLSGASGDITLLDCEYIEIDGIVGLIAIGQPESVLIWRDDIATSTPVIQPTEVSITPSPTMDDRDNRVVYLPSISSVEIPQ